MFKLAILAALVAAALGLNLDPNERIVGGAGADITAHPYQLSVQYYGTHICGGTIIAEKWVVTAGLCTVNLVPSQLNILAGVTNTFEPGQEIKVARIFVHPNYALGDSKDYDIAVLELAEPIAFGDNARPVALPAENSDPAEGTGVVCSGWGVIQEGGWPITHLYAVSMQIISRDACNDQYGGSVTKRMICAGVPEGGRGFCAGDEGGPLVANGVLVGVSSWSTGCGRPNYPSVYANVGNLRGFIRNCSELLL